MIPKKFIDILDQFMVRVGIKEGLTLDLFWTPNNFEKKILIGTHLLEKSF